MPAPKQRWLAPQTPTPYSRGARRETRSSRCTPSPRRRPRRASPNRGSRSTPTVPAREHHQQERCRRNRPQAPRRKQCRQQPRNRRLTSRHHLPLRPPVPWTISAPWDRKGTSAAERTPALHRCQEPGVRVAGPVTRHPTSTRRVGRIRQWTLVRGTGGLQTASRGRVRCSGFRCTVGTVAWRWSMGRTMIRPVGVWPARASLADRIGDRATRARGDAR